MKNFIQTHKLRIIGAIVGALGGYLYYYFIGCASGTCPITSNPYISIGYGTLLGILLFDLFRKSEKKQPKKNKPNTFK